MPLYEYECTKCRHRFEKIESVDSSATKKCPKCGARAERLLASPAIQFKGSGWYVTDYAGKGASREPKSEPTEAKQEKGKEKESKPKAEKGAPAKKN